MHDPGIFVGRRNELEALKAAIDDQEGKLVLVVGPEGCGKTALLRKLQQELMDQPDRYVLHYSLTENDTAESSLAQLMDDLPNLRDLTRYRLLRGTPPDPDKVKALIDLVSTGAAMAASALPIAGPLVSKAVEAAGAGAKSLVSTPVGPARDRFLRFLQATAGKLSPAARLVLLLDPYGHLHPTAEGEWVAIVRDLPKGVSVVVAQQTNDCLARPTVAWPEGKVRQVPAGGLTGLPDTESEELVAAHWSSTPAWIALQTEPPGELVKELVTGHGQSPLELTMAVQSLPTQPPLTVETLLSAAKTMPAGIEWLLHSRYDAAVAGRREAVYLLEGLAVLGRPATPRRLADMFAERGVDAAAFLAVANVPEVAACLTHDAGNAFSLFGGSLRKFILEQPARDHSDYLHRAAAALYRNDIAAGRPTIDALELWPYHCLEAGDETEFLRAVDELCEARRQRGMLRSCLADLEKALEIQRRLAGSDPDQDKRVEYESMVAGSLRELGRIHRELGERVKARDSYQEAVAIYNRLAGLDFPRFGPVLADTLNALGTAFRDLWERATARQVYGIAYDRYRRLAGDDPHAFLGELAATLNHVGDVQNDLGAWTEAAATYEESLELYRGAAREEPQQFELRVAALLNSLGEVRHRLRDNAGALAAYDEALPIHRRWARDDDPRCESELAATLTSRGLIYHDLDQEERAQHDFKQAVECYERTLEVRRKFANSEPGLFRCQVAATCNDLGTVLRLSNRAGDAAERHQEALDIYRDLAGTEPAAFRPDVAMTLKHLGNAHRDAHDEDKAVKAYRDCIVEYRDLVRAEPKVFSSYLEIAVGDAWEHLDAATQDLVRELLPSLVAFPDRGERQQPD